MLSVKYITQVYPHWLPCHYPSTILHSWFQTAEVHTAQHSFEIWHSYRDVPEDLSLLEGVALSPHERFPTFWWNTVPSSSRVKQCKKHISKELWPFATPATTHQTTVSHPRRLGSFMTSLMLQQFFKSLANKIAGTGNRLKNIINNIKK